MPNDMNTIDQILNLVDKNQKILLLTHAKADCDGLGSMISMYQALKALGKDVIAATNDPAPDNLSFLPSMNIVQNSLRSVEDFIITLDVSRTPLKKIRYNLEEAEKGDQAGKVNIIITPKLGQFHEQDISFSTPEGESDEAFDLIITFDTGNLEHLGSLYDKNTALFTKTPLINIDHHASNTDFGQVNLVDVVAASTTEVMLGVLQKMEERYDKIFINEDIATLLLAGLITDTGSFQHANTSPNAMEVAAELLDLGARQQEIIKNIYKSKHLSTLKLWGIILSKVQTDPIYRMVWSDISKKDLQESGANSDESEGIIDDLLSNAPGAEVIMLFKENEEGYISVSMRSTTNSADVGKIATDMGGGGHVRAAGFKVRQGKSLEEVIEMTLKKVKSYQSERLNIHPDTVHQPAEEVSKKIPEKKPPVLTAKPSASDDKKEEKYLDFDTLDASDETFAKKEEKASEPSDQKSSEKEAPENKKEVEKVDSKEAKKAQENLSIKATSNIANKETPKEPVTLNSSDKKEVNQTDSEKKLLEKPETPKKETMTPPSPHPFTAPDSEPKKQAHPPAANAPKNAVPEWLNPQMHHNDKKEPVADKISPVTPTVSPTTPQVATPQPSQINPSHTPAAQNLNAPKVPQAIPTASAAQSTGNPTQSMSAVPIPPNTPSVQPFSNPTVSAPATHPPINPSPTLTPSPFASNATPTQNGAPVQAPITQVSGAPTAPISPHPTPAAQNPVPNATPTPPVQTTPSAATPPKTNGTSPVPPPNPAAL